MLTFDNALDITVKLQRKSGFTKRVGGKIKMQS